MGEQKLYRGKYRVWTSVSGSQYKGLCLAHLVPAGEHKTLCGRQRGHMTTRWSVFTPSQDCQRCAKKAGLL